MTIPRARIPLALALLTGCGTSATTTPAAPPIANRTAASGSDSSMVPLPKEPWYGDKPEHRDDCVAALPAIPPKHFPAPFEACDPQSESWSSPPGSGELHFHYRDFSVALTTARRQKTPGTCCYMVWEFPGR